MALTKYRKYQFGELVYDVNLSQAGVAAPTVAATRENTLGAVVLGYTAPGVYTATLAGAFATASKVDIYTSNSGPAGIPGGVSASVIDANTIQIDTTDTGALADGVLDNTPFKIVVRP